MYKKLNCFVLIGMICFLVSGCPAKSEEIADTAPETANFFFPGETVSCTYRVKTSIYELSSVEQVDLTITEINRFEEGVLYELKWEEDERIVDQYGIPVLYLGLFFVQDDKIYRIRDEAVKDERSDGKTIMEKGTLVCCEEGMADALLQEERGWHEYILADGDKREYHGYNTLVETGYYESFTWEEGKGLTGYRRGYGAEAEAVELYAP